MECAKVGGRVMGSEETEVKGESWTVTRGMCDALSVDTTKRY